jgi:hypothetical protein
VQALGYCNYVTGAQSSEKHIYCLQDGRQYLVSGEILLHEFCAISRLKHHL